MIYNQYIYIYIQYIYILYIYIHIVYIYILYAYTCITNIDGTSNMDLIYIEQNRCRGSPSSKALRKWLWIEQCQNCGGFNGWFNGLKVIKQCSMAGLMVFLMVVFHGGSNGGSCRKWRWMNRSGWLHIFLQEIFGCFGAAVTFKPLLIHSWDMQLMALHLTWTRPIVAPFISNEPTSTKSFRST